MPTRRVRALGLLLAALLVPACGVGGGGTLSPTVAPGVPTALRALAGNKRVTILWSSPASGATFTVKRSLTSGGPYFPVSVATGFSTPTTYVDLGLANQTEYFYVVAASNQFGESANSVEVRGTPGFKARSIASGCAASHSLAILQDRNLWSFGNNTFSKLGNGRISGQTAVPTPVVNLDEVTAAGASESHSVALRNDGTVWSWGRNNLGQLGRDDSINGDGHIPNPVPGLSDIVGLSLGRNHTLALKNDGTVWAWGDNTRGQIGNGVASVQPVAVPFQIPGLTNIRLVAAGSLHSLAVGNDGIVWAWGDNTQGQLGQGATGILPGKTPVQVPNLTGIVDAAAGNDHSITVRSDGSIWIWGMNDQGVLGVGSGAAAVAKPTAVPGVSQAVSVSAGGGTSYAVLLDGSAMAWGYNSDGQCGLGTQTASTPTPTLIPSLNSIAAVAAGKMHALAVRDDGTVLSWGSNQFGQLGNGQGNNYNVPIQVPNFTDVTAVAIGPSHIVALRGDGTVWTWGDNTKGQLGNGVVLPGAVATPFQVPGLSGITAVAASSRNSYAVKDDGTVWAWGDNSSGQMGQGGSSATPTTSPVKVLGLTGVFTSVSAGTSFVIARRDVDGTLWGWGNNSDGYLGTGLPGPVVQHPPVQVTGLAGITSISSGIAHTVALRDADKAVFTWGNNTSGQIGDGSPTGTIVRSPQQILTGAVSISAGDEFTLAALSDGTVSGWGFRAFGQLGDGPPSATPALSPVQTLGIGNVLTVAAGQSHSLALKNDGTVWGWGYNFYGQLGNGDEIVTSGPVQTLDISSPTTIAAGGLSSMCILPDRTLRGWGSNGLRQMAITVVNPVTKPVAIQP